jgi:membrane protease YdiL (CAAX protease family)
MILKPSQLFSNALPSGKPGKFFQYPLIRIVTALLFLVPVFLLNKAVSEFIVKPAPEEIRVYAMYTDAIVFFILFLLAFSLYTKYIEKRRALEISSNKSWSEFGLGFLISLILVGLIVFIFYIFGSYKISEWNTNKRVVIDFFFKFLMGGLIEEIIFRLIIFKLTEELLGSWFAFGIQAVLFGFAHIFNENATLFTSLAVIIVGGILLTSAFMYTHRIWLPMGIHTGWNYFQSAIFGMPNSGTPYKGLIIPDVQGAQWFTGGSFGIEASYIAILLCLAAGIYFTIKSVKANQIVPPLWKRKNSAREQT